MQVNAGDQSIDKCECGRCSGVFRSEFRALHKRQRQRLFRLFECRSINHLTSIRAKLGIQWLPAQSTFVNAVDKIAGFLKLELDKEGCAYIYSLVIQAVVARAARSDLIGPVVQPTLICETTQEIDVMLAHEEIRVVDCDHLIAAGPE